MFARQQELNTQFHQLLDAALLAFSLFTPQAFRFDGTGWLDLPYSIDRWSLGLDCKILLRTIPAVRFGLGAK